MSDTTDEVDNTAAVLVQYPGPIPLLPVVKDYAWGIRGMDSRVGRYALTCGTIQEIDPDTPYAELWVGTHPSGPARLQDETPLQDAIGGELPFLFKILSAGKALSIQAHPDKDVAARLHAENPSCYADVSATRRAFCSFFRFVFEWAKESTPTHIRLFLFSVPNRQTTNQKWPSRSPPLKPCVAFVALKRFLS